MILGDNRYSIYSYYIFWSPRSVYFIKNDKDNMARDVFDRNI